MRVLRGRNVCELLPAGLRMLMREGRREDSRAGPVLVMPEPVTSVYERPTERVLVDARRDANPLFHLMESLWMLSGRNDAAMLDHYVRDFGQRFAEPNGTIHGAYGHRWRHAFGHDQLDAVVERMRRNPQERQCVIQMWDTTPLHTVEQGGTDNVGDLESDGVILAGCDDLHGAWRDRPCNTHLYLRVRNDEKYKSSSYGDDSESLEYVPVLDLTVCCRSNDVIWGAYGANAVHFSVLQEYLAGRIGCSVGTMFQVSNNYHVYVDALARLGDEPLEEVDPYATSGSTRHYAPLAMGENWSLWDEDLRLFVMAHDAMRELPDDSMELDLPDGISNSWFYAVPWHAATAYWLHRAGRRDEALMEARQIEAWDWQHACVEWLERRYAR